ncbi:tryptophan-rich sensory protein [Candidatus Saccharibacteria bacterium]|nr:tryptophan-rich sensory protein [Candidatus Saccharibacteria bacterium]
MSAWGIIWRVILCVAVPLGGGFIISLLTMNAQEVFGQLNQPPLAPPAWLFPVAWTILYILMGLASFFIYYYGTRDKEARKAALIFYGIQLAFNFAWSLVFFNAKQYYVAFAILVVMWILIILTMAKASKVSKLAVACLVPYLLWVTFAGYLNIMIAILN